MERPQSAGIYLEPQKLRIPNGGGGWRGERISYAKEIYGSDIWNGFRRRGHTEQHSRKSRGIIIANKCLAVFVQPLNISIDQHAVGALCSGT